MNSYKFSTELSEALDELNATTNPKKAIIAKVEDYGVEPFNVIIDKQFEEATIEEWRNEINQYDPRCIFFSKDAGEGTKKVVIKYVPNQAPVKQRMVFGSMVIPDYGIQLNISDIKSLTNAEIDEMMEGRK